MKAPVPTWSERVYRWLVACYPPAFRALFAQELCELMRDRLRDARRHRGRVGVLGVWLRVLPDLIASALQEWWLELRRPDRRFTTSRRAEPMRYALIHDLYQAWRGLRRQPLLAVGVIAILALGIGANTALFSVVDAVVLRPLPFASPEQLIAVWNRYGDELTSNAPPDFVDRLRAGTLEGAAATTTTTLSLSDESGRPAQITAARVTASLWRVLGVAPELGMPGFPAYDSPREDRLAVLSYGLWQQRYGGDPGVVGRELWLDGEAYTVTAVMPRTLDFPRGSEVWLPLTFSPAELSDDARGNEYLSVVARLAEGRSLEEARAEMTTIAAQVIESVPERADFLLRSGWGAGVVSLETELVGDSRPALMALFGAVGLVLLLACANVANLLLARSTGRRQELALRVALGARRSRLTSLLLGESALLAFAAAAIGGGLAWGFLRLAPRWIPHHVPRLVDASLDGRSLAFGALAAALVALASGALPAWRAWSLAQGGGARTTSGRTDRRLQRLLVVYEVAAAMVLLVAAGLLLRSFASLASTDPGFFSEGRLVFRLSLPANDYPDASSRQIFRDQLLGELRSLPGVRRAAVASRMPLDGQISSRSFDIEGYVPGPGEPDPGGDFAVVSPGYVEALGIRLLQGRTFSASDRADGERVAMIDQWTADRFWPEGDAVGHDVNINPSDAPVWRRIVGVVGHVTKNTRDETGKLQLYLPSTQSRLRHLHVVVEAHGRPTDLVPAIRRVVGGLAATLPVFDIRTLDQLIASSIALPRFNLQVLGAFALVALLLAAAGLYGVLTYVVQQRRTEIGVRMALGASTGNIFRVIVGEGLLLAVVGLALGSLGAFAAGRLLAGLLYGIAPTDPVTFLVIACVLLVVAWSAVKSRPRPRPRPRPRASQPAWRAHAPAR